MRRVLVTGSRDWADWMVIRAALVGVRHPIYPGTLVHGGARGADKMAAHVARDMGWLIEPHPADWDQHGKRAGFVRNAEMVKAGADVCLAFIRNNSRGATMCARLAEDAGIPVQYYRA